jgi:carboxypeptidase T
MDDGGVNRRALLCALGIAGPLLSVPAAPALSRSIVEDTTATASHPNIRVRQRSRKPAMSGPRPADDEVWDLPARGGYHSYASLIADIDSLVSSAPKFVSRESLGRTYETREIVGFRIKPVGGATRKRVFLVGGHHARERISVEVPFLFGKYIIERALAGQLPAYLRQTEILIVPVLNSDGYAYLAAENYRWNWRTNRSPQHANFGVDLNRNYPWRWGEGHCSGTEGSDLYRGPAALSEKETQAIKALFDNAKPQFDALVTYHSYGQKILYPWASETYTGGNPLIDSLIIVANQMVDVSRKMGVAYKAMPASELYGEIIGGELCDWAMRQYGISAIGVELPSDDNGAGIKLRAADLEASFTGHLPAIMKFFEWINGR